MLYCCIDMLSPDMRVTSLKAIASEQLSKNVHLISTTSNFANHQKFVCLEIASLSAYFYPFLCLLLSLHRTCSLNLFISLPLSHSHGLFFFFSLSLSPFLPLTLSPYQTIIYLLSITIMLSPYLIHLYSLSLLRQ